MTKLNNLNLMVGGFAGQGVNTVSNAFARLCSRAGLHVFVNLEYPSNIKGEHTFVQVMISGDPVGSHTRPVDLLLALDAKSVVAHAEEIVPGGVLIYDSEGLEVSPVDVGLKVENIGRDDITVVDLPMAQIAKDVGGSKRMINSIGLGAVQGLLDFDFELLATMLRETFPRLDEETIRGNLDGARRAYDLVREKYSAGFGVTLEKKEAPPRMLLTGNDAVAMGALKAGVKFYASYPMTPSSAVLSYLSKHARDFNMVTVLPEDEISAAGMTIGASFAGVRAMTGTSGGGFCLMTEYLGLAAIAEIPLVILEGQRPGPATGLPTRTEQGDLKFVLSAHQGEFPRIVVAPGDPEEAFRLTFEAFNLAERYQTPVIILTDKHLGESFWTCDKFDMAGMKIDRGEWLDTADAKAVGDYKRYGITKTGLSPRARPGMPGVIFKASGNEHTETGMISEDADNRAAQMAKRLRKTVSLDVSRIGVNLHGDPQAELTLVGWGSTKPVILDVMRELDETTGLKCNFLQVVYMEPFPVDRVSSVLKAAGRVMLIENNATGQLGQLIRQHTGIAIEEKLLKYNGRQFFRDELAELIRRRFEN